MKLSKITIFILIAGLMFMGCKKKVDKVLFKGTGEWTIVSEHTVIEINNNPFSDETELNVGHMHFNKDLTGTLHIKIDETQFIWQYDEPRNQIRLTDSVGVTVYDILECTKTAMTIYTADSVTLFTTKTKEQITLELEKK